MKSFEQLKALNNHLQMFHVTNDAFKRYGTIITSYHFKELEAYMERTTVDSTGNLYVASVPEMEQTEVKQQIQTNFYGDMPIQIGYCNGPNCTLNGLEYHKGSEINIAITDLVLLVGCVQEIKHNQFDSKNVKAFFVPKGTAIELYGTTLHFAPCKVHDDGFKVVVILPKGTNEPLEHKFDTITDEDKLLFMKNKWLLAHPDREVLIHKGAYPGIIGENLEVHYESASEKRT
ncbi:DUF4867 family protein [Metabacillus iocasae]|uniref:DUF4867 domain-containing protein n=1 Tax=Priestia iocasae TaxID=2291674 RepID=A0ABS2QU56_9BACI|nr:DUF4867 family protein [Metabacillus iocasae]MBM7702738.1 hypothetical protein [Metabacillus iocasae]